MKPDTIQKLKLELQRRKGSEDPRVRRMVARLLASHPQLRGAN